MKTNRNAWNYNSSHSKLKQNTQRMIDFYNQQVADFHDKKQKLPEKITEREKIFKTNVDMDPKKFSWNTADFKRGAKQIKYEVDESKFYESIYRPYFKQHINFALILFSMALKLGFCIHQTKLSSFLPSQVNILRV